MMGTLGLYIARKFAGIVAWAFVAVFSLVLVVQLVELMREAADAEAGFRDLFVMALFFTPSVVVTAAPFTVLLAAMLCFAVMARHAELVAARAAGVSAWRLITPALVAAVLLGVFTFAIYNPLAAAFAARFEALQEQILEKDGSRLSVTGDGIWLRQGDAAGQTVIRARRASEDLSRLWRVSVFRFDTGDGLIGRLEARTAVLAPGEWRLSDVRSWRLAEPETPPAQGLPEAPGDDAPDSTGAPGAPGAPDSTDAPGAADVADRASATLYDEVTLPTDLTLERIEESFAPPRTVSFWALPGFIDTLEEQGFTSRRHRFHWHALLATPAVFAAMVLIGGAVSMRHRRFGGLGGMALAVLLAGFSYFFLSDISGALGASGAVPVILAAWGPPMAGMLAALGLLLHLEDG